MHNVVTLDEMLPTLLMFFTSAPLIVRYGRKRKIPLYPFLITLTANDLKSDLNKNKSYHIFLAQIKAGYLMPPSAFR